MLTFHDYKQHGFVVMDGNRCVAKAKPVSDKGWLLRMCGGCWTDPRARTQGLIPGAYPDLMHVSTRREARKIMQGLIQ